MSIYQKFLTDEEATVAFGRELARATYVDTSEISVEILVGAGTETIGGLIHLNGDLGVGKTTLTRGIMRGYGYSGPVKSPTYTLVEPYELEKCQIYHFDLYRLANPEEVEYLGVEDYFQSTNLCIVEWANLGKGSIPAADIVIELETEGTGRRLSFQSQTQKGHRIAERLWR